MAKIFKMKPTDDFHVEHLIKADDKREAYYLFLEQCLGDDVKLSSYQMEDVLKNLVVGNPLFDIIECEEVLP